MDSAQEMRASTTVLVVDDHIAFSEAIGTAIDLQHDLVCVGVAATAEAALELVGEQSPDVVLMDVHLPDLDGIEATARVKALRPEARVVVLTSETSSGVAARAAIAGASGFLLKTSPIADVLAAVRTAGEGGMLVDPSTLAAVLQGVRASPGPQPRRAAPIGLTPRELEVLRLLGQGLDTRAIAKRLGISLHTCRGHVKSILSELGVHSQLEAVVSAVREGLIPALR